MSKRKTFRNLKFNSYDFLECLTYLLTKGKCFEIYAFLVYHKNVKREDTCCFNNLFVRSQYRSQTMQNQLQQYLEDDAAYVNTSHVDEFSLHSKEHGGDLLICMQ